MLKVNEAQGMLIDKKRLIYYTILYIILVVFFAGWISLYYTKSNLHEQLKSDALNFANQAMKYIDQKQITKNLIIDHMEEKMSIAGKQILENKGKINNKWLKKLAEDFGISEIYYYTPDGKVIYSASEEYIGWQASHGDPIHDFMVSNKTIYHEEIRKGTETDKLYKFSYFKEEEGSFVQLGYYAEEVMANISSYDYQSIVNEITTNENVYYAIITDKNMITIADSDESDVGMDWSQEAKYQDALKGNAAVFELYYEEIDDIVYEVVVPFIVDDEIIGVFAIGQSLQNVNEIIKISYIRMILLSIVISLLLIWNQRHNIIRPIIRLHKEISEIDIEKKHLKRLELKKNDVFSGVRRTFNTLLDSIEGYIIKIDKANAILAFNAYHDHLTGLKNRRALDEYLADILHKNCCGALLMLSLKNLKELNEIYGHKHGDFIIKTLAKRLVEIAPRNQCFSFNGEEFVIVILGKQRDYEEQIINIIKKLNQPATNENQVYDVGCFVGVSRFPYDSVDSDKLIQMADTAMVYVKNNSDHEYAYYESFMTDKLKEKNNIFNLLAKIINDKSFRLVYQPIIDTKTGEIASFEALLRLPDNSISPSKFIPIAEEKGLIKAIGNITVENVIKQLKCWRDGGYKIKPISINISPKHFIDDYLFQFIKENLENYNIEPSYVEIEITEEVFVEDKIKTASAVDRFRKLGVKTSLDDFGSGYSSLNYLTIIPFHKIKLDKSLNDRFLDESNYKIIESIINISHELGSLVVAEGIEVKEQHEILKKIKCDYEQGYLFSKPIPVDEVENILSK